MSYQEGIWAVAPAPSCAPALGTLGNFPVRPLRKARVKGVEGGGWEDRSVSRPKAMRVGGLNR